MTKQFVAIFICSIISLHASNFRNGMIAFQKAQYDKAKIFFEVAITDDKSTHASYMLGRMYLNGKGVTVDTKKSIALLTMAYKYGNIPAGCYLSRAHIQNGINVYLAAEGVKRGIEKNVKFCKETLQLYRAYNEDKFTFSDKLKKKFKK